MDVSLFLMGARGAIWFDIEFGLRDLPRQPLYVGHSPRSRARKANVGHADAQLFHQVQDFNFFLDGRVFDGRRLQAVTQRLIV